MRAEAVTAAAIERECGFDFLARKTRGLHVAVEAFLAGGNALVSGQCLGGGRGKSTRVKGGLQLGLGRSITQIVNSGPGGEQHRHNGNGKGDGGVALLVVQKAAEEVAHVLLPCLTMKRLGTAGARGGPGGVATGTACKSRFTDG